MPPEDKNRIEDLQRNLYSRSAPDIRSRRKLHISNDAPEVREDWGDAPKGEQSLDEMIAAGEGGGRKRMHFATKFLLGSAVFCLIALAVGALIFFRGGNFISGNNIAIDVSGPVSVPGGTPVSFGIVVTNRNSVTLNAADLVVHFPAGATDPADTTRSLEEYHVALGDIPAGGSVTKSVSAVIFGEENSQKNVVVDVTYGIAGSNSTFTKEATHDVVVNASPISLSVSAPQEAISGQEVALRVDVKSNTSNPVKNVLLRAAYPFGFTYKSASADPLTADDTVWSIGDIPAGGSRSITIRGALTGEDADVRTFRFTAGARSQTSPTLIGTVFLETEQVLSVKKPFLSLALTLDNDSTKGDYVGRFGRPVTVNVKWSNNLPETLSNVVVTAHLSGNAYDKNTVAAWSGFYRSATDDVVWDQKTNPELASVAAGAEGTLSFTISPSESQASDTHISSPQISIAVSGTSDRVEGSSVPLSTGSQTRRIKVTGDPGLKARIVRTGTSFMNTGAIPPIAEKPTTYTVIWDVEPSSNPMSGVTVSGALPPGVTWLDQASPSTEQVAYDKNSGVVTWNVGSVNSASASASLPPREVMFQISLEPSVAQVGTAPILVNQITLNGTDAWTSSAVHAQQGYLTTSFTTDPTFRPGMETVVSNR